jgi:hypothetical protein
MVGGSTNKLTAAGFDQVDKKASTFNAAVVSRLDMYHTKVLMYRMMVLTACLTKVRR